LWALDDYFAPKILKMLKAYKKVCIGFPGHLTSEEWDEILDKMILGFDRLVNEDTDYLLQCSTKDMVAYHKSIQEACELFGKYFQTLWN